MSRRSGARPGWTLIELLVVIAILGVLAGLILPAIQKIRESAQRVQCQNKLRQIGLALHLYYDVHNLFPPSYIGGDASSAGGPSSGNGIQFFDRRPLPPPASQAPGWAWGALLLPYLEQGNLAAQINWKSPVDGPGAATVRTTILPIYVCPADSHTGIFDVQINNPLAPMLLTAATTSYAACYGAQGLVDIEPELGNGLMVRNRSVRKEDVSDGLTTTIAIGERASLLAQTPWAGVFTAGTVVTTPGAPVYTTVVEGPPTQAMARIGRRPLQNPNSEPYDFFSPHRQIVNFVFADGAVHALSSDIDVTVLWALASRAGGEVVSGSAY